MSGAYYRQIVLHNLHTLSKIIEVQKLWFEVTIFKLERFTYFQGYVKLCKIVCLTLSFTHIYGLLKPPKIIISIWYYWLSLINKSKHIFTSGSIPIKTITFIISKKVFSKSFAFLNLLLLLLFWCFVPIYLYLFHS